MAWVAVDRAVKTVENFGMDGAGRPLARGCATRIHAEVCERGWDRRAAARSRSPTAREPLDASLLLIPPVGFLPPDDPRVLGTVEAIERELCVDGFVLRYPTEESDDGLPPGEGAFLPCTFWLVDALALIGRRDEAVELFERLLGLCNDVGLLAEEYDPQARAAGRQLPAGVQPHRAGQQRDGPEPRGARPGRGAGGRGSSVSVAAV